MESKDTQAIAETAVCERCGNFDVIEIAGKVLCAECVTLAGCSCGGDN
jgi:hypothetical protein